MVDLPDISDLVPELICLSVDALICGILYKVYVDTNAAIDEIKKAPSLDLETAKSVSQFILENGGVSTEDDREITIPYIIVRGAVTPMKSSLESHHSKGFNWDFLPKISFFFTTLKPLRASWV